MYAFSFVLLSLGMAIAASRPMITTTNHLPGTLTTATTMLKAARRGQLAILHRTITLTQKAGHMSIAHRVRCFAGFRATARGKRNAPRRAGSTLRGVGRFDLLHLGPARRTRHILLGIDHRLLLERR